MVQLYILDKTNMEILFSDSFDKKKSSLSPEYVNFVFSFYKDSLKYDELKGLEALYFKDKKFLLLEKHAFVFILLVSSNSDDELAKSQLYFLMNMFLNAFGIQDDDSAISFIEEIKTHRDHSTLSPYISQTFEIKKIIDLHLKQIEFRNFLEVWINIINSIIASLKSLPDFSKKEEQDKGANINVKVFVSKLKKLIEEKASSLFEIIEISDDNEFCLKENINFSKFYLEKIKTDMISLLDSTFNSIVDIFGEKSLSYVSKYVKSVMLLEWRRVNSLDVSRELIKICWR